MSIESLEPVFLLSGRLLLGGVLVLAGAAKLRDVRSFTLGVLNYAILPYRASLVAARGLPPIEVLLAAALIGGLAVKAAAVAALAVLAAFAVAVAVNLLRGRRIDCHCFGADAGDRLGPSTVVRLIGLIAVALYLVVRSGPDLMAAPPGLSEFVAAALLVLAVLQLYALMTAFPYLIAALRAKAIRGASPQGGRIQLRHASPNLRFRVAATGSNGRGLQMP